MSDILLTKTLYTVLGGLLFLSYTTPKTSQVLNLIFNTNIFYNGSCHTPLGHLTLFVLFFVTLIIFKSLYNSIVSCSMRSDFSDVLKYSVVATLLFYLLSNKELFILTNDFFNKYLNVNTVELNGCPTRIGIVLHTLLFMGIMFLLMHLI